MFIGVLFRTNLLKIFLHCCVLGFYDSHGFKLLLSFVELILELFMLVNAVKLNLKALVLRLET